MPDDLRRAAVFEPRRRVCASCKETAARFWAAPAGQRRSAQPGPIRLIGPRRRIMPRKPNYRFERFERERTRAAKKAARAQAKAERKAKASEAVSDQAAAAERAAPSDDDDVTSD
jgi:hypothetical protein